MGSTRERRNHTTRQLKADTSKDIHCHPLKATTILPCCHPPAAPDKGLLIISRPDVPHDADMTCTHLPLSSLFGFKQAQIALHVGQGVFL